MRSCRSLHDFLFAGMLAALVGTMSACIPIPGPTRTTVTLEEEEQEERPEENPGTGRSKVSLEQLIQDGLTFAALANSFELSAPVKGGAPVVVDFELDRDGLLRLEVTVEDAEHALEFRASAGERKLEISSLPPGLGDWQAATLSVTAWDDSGQQQPGANLLGLGIGERAVGSTAIYQVTFGPVSVDSSRAATWGFRSRQDFERAQIEIYRQEEVHNGGSERLTRAFPSTCLPRRGKRCDGEWDGQDAHGVRSQGPHRVSVKAWQQTGLERDWILVRSAELVEVR